MKVDLTPLEKLYADSSFSPLEGNSADNAEKPVKSSDRAPEGQSAVFYHSLEAAKAEKATMQRMFADCQENIRKAGQLRSDILKGIQEGEDITLLFLKAAECIARMTGEERFFEQCKEQIISIHGWALDESEPLHVQLQEAEDRLKKLARPELDGMDGIREARRRHGQLIQRLREKLG